MTRTITLLTALVLSTAAQAEQITLTSPMQAQSLHEPGVDMVVYFLEADDAYEVVATYIEVAQPDTPYRMRMALQDGDEVTFGLPGVLFAEYTFGRTDDTVVVTSTTKRPIAALK